MPSSGVKTSALRSEEHTSELQPHDNLVCRLLLEKKTWPPPSPLRPSLFLPRAVRSSLGVCRGAVRAGVWGGGVLGAPLGLALVVVVFFLVMPDPPKYHRFPKTPAYD